VSSGRVIVSGMTFPHTHISCFSMCRNAFFGLLVGISKRVGIE